MSDVDGRKNGLLLIWTAHIHKKCGHYGRRGTHCFPSWWKYVLPKITEVPLQSGRMAFWVGRLFRYFGSCWDQGTGEDPTQPLTLTLSLTPNRSQNETKLAMNMEFSQLRAMIPKCRPRNFQVENTPKNPFSQIAKPTPITSVKPSSRGCQTARITNEVDVRHVLIAPHVFKIFKQSGRISTPTKEHGNERNGTRLFVVIRSVPT